MSAVAEQSELYDKMLGAQKNQIRQAVSSPSSGDPAASFDWVGALAHTSEVMSRAFAATSERQAGLYQQMLAAQQKQMASLAVSDDDRLRAQVELLRGQTAQTLAELRGVIDDCMDAWFDAAGIVADMVSTAAPAAAAGSGKAAVPLRASDGASTGPSKTPRRKNAHPDE
ncbi:MAG: hypothetical protein KGJ97_01210 [Xanthomonadaceae bacterium]|nr:hypothetical protein [Xanthomonadaceae bacterium]MDE3072801.1 hypothetical protein [Pseudomonadota bacterium]